jgi:hypothetical protein
MAAAGSRRDGRSPGRQAETRGPRKGNFSCHIALTGMTYENRVKPVSSSIEREARLEKRRIEAQKAMADHEKAEAAFRANYERLKAERLAREAQK